MTVRGSIGSSATGFGADRCHHRFSRPSDLPISRFVSGLPVQYKLAALVVIAALAAVVAVLALKGGGSSSPPASPQQVNAADAKAQAAARTAETAMEVWATDRGGSYEGASTDALRRIEPTLPSSLEVKASPAGYSVTVPAEVGGNSFTIERNANGVSSFTCQVPGTADCPAGGQWAGH